MKKYSDLVSVAVITYNSSNFILDCLESIKEQSYQNLELIVSDDCSTDDTVFKIKSWTDKNSDRFSNIILNFSQTNKGVSANTSEACKLANGTWVKPIAGDDMLLKESIFEYVNYIKKNKSQVVYSKVKKLNNNTLSDKAFPFDTSFYFKEAKEQYKMLLNGQSFYSPTEFYSKQILIKMNYFDHGYRNIEDLPFLLNYTSKGNKIDFINKALVIYRISDESSSNNYLRNNTFVNINYFKDLRSIYEDLIFPKVSFHNLLHHIDKKIQFLRFTCTIFFGNTKKAYKILGFLNLFNPQYYLLKFGLKKISE